MTTLTITSRIRPYWVAAILLVSLIFLTGATWYFTPKSESRPEGTPTPTPKNVVASKFPTAKATSIENQAPVASSAALAPFLDVVPLQDGTGLFISAGGVGELEGEVFVNIGVGPGHNKGSTNMVYSGTLYIATVTGFTPAVGTSGPMNITTTLGLDTGTVDFNRGYIPPSTTSTISSQDGNLQLTVVSTDTFPSEAYVAIVPSYAPPGPLPAEHRLVGSSYSVRASGALATSDKPMNLRLGYDSNTLAGADPHTLAIFAWDAFNKQWDNLGGTLFSTQQFVSVATSRFTTYALVSEPAWHDNFDEFSGLDFTQLINVTFGGTPENRTLVLASTPGNGSAVSQPITPTTQFANWGTLTYSSVITPPTTTLTVDILSSDGSEVLTGVASGTNLAGLVDPTQHPGLRLRVNMASTAAGETPVLERWQLGWQVEEYQVYLPVVLK